MLGVLAGLLLTVATGTAQYVEDSVDVGARAVGSLVYNSREDVLYGASEEGTLFAISCDSNRVVESLHLQYAFRVAYDSIDNKAYCTFYNTQTDDSVLVVDGATHTRIKSMPLDGANTPVWDAVSNKLYVSSYSTNAVAVVDCATDSVLMYIPVGACPLKMCINTLRRKLYVLNYDDGTVSIVDMATNQVIRTVATSAANAGYYCRSADKFYCSGPSGQSVVIGGQCDTVIARCLYQAPAVSSARSGTRALVSSTSELPTLVVAMTTSRPCRCRTTPCWLPSSLGESPGECSSTPRADCCTALQREPTKSAF